MAAMSAPGLLGQDAGHHFYAGRLEPQEAAPLASGLGSAAPVTRRLIPDSTIRSVHEGPYAFCERDEQGSSVTRLCPRAARAAPSRAMRSA